MESLKQNIIEFSSILVEKWGFFLVDVIIRGDNRKKIIELFIDSEKNLSAEDLSQISRELESYIENNNIVSGSYRLDVSTPGVDRPLKFLKQFPKHINRQFELEYNQADGTNVKYKGRLLSIQDDLLTFSDGKNEIKILFNQITKAKVLISFT